MDDQPVVDQETYEQLEHIAARLPAVARPKDLRVLAQAILAILERLDNQPI